MCVCVCVCDCVRVYEGRKEGETVSFGLFFFLFFSSPLSLSLSLSPLCCLHCANRSRPLHHQNKLRLIIPTRKRQTKRHRRTKGCRRRYSLSPSPLSLPRILTSRQHRLSSLTPMQTIEAAGHFRARSGHCALRFGNRVYVFGGYNVRPSSIEPRLHLDARHRRAPAEPQLELFDPLPRPLHSS